MLFVLAPKGSLAGMQSNGQLARFLRNYVDAYVADGYDVGLLSWGALEEELRLAGETQLTIIAPRRRSGWLWAVWAPVRHWHRLRRYGVWRGLQGPACLTLVIGKLLLGARVVVTYGYDYVEFSTQSGDRATTARAHLLARLLRVCLPRMDRVIVTSPAVRQQAVAAGAREEHIIQIANAAPVAAAPASERSPRSVLWIGRIAGQKRVDIAVQAARRARARLTIVGRGELEPHDMRDLEESGGRFLGAVDHAQVMELLDRSEVFLLTSEYEGTPKVVIEALARGTATLVPTLPELSWLFDRPDSPVAVFATGDVDEAARRLEELLDDEPSRRHLAHTGHALARAEFDLSTEVAREIGLVTELLDHVGNGNGAIDILSPALGWQKAPNLGGARYESMASEVLLASGRTRLLLPASQADGFPRSRLTGRLWLRQWNRPLVLGAYLPLQLVFELLRWRPRVLRLHSMSHLALPGIAGAAVARAVGWRGAVAVHLHHLDESGTAERNRGRRGRVIDHVVIRFADRIVVDAHATKRVVEDRFRRARGKVAVAPAALPAAIIHESPSLVEGTLRLAFIGRLESRKRPLEFADVCRRVAGARPMSATMVGTGPLEHEVMSAIEGLPIEVAGFIPSLDELYASADIVVCTSTVEGFYLVGLEAMQRGVPLMGFDTPVVRELLGPDLQSCLVPDGDVDALATRIAGLSAGELDELRRRSLTRAAYFTPDLFAARLQMALLGPIPGALSG